MQTLKFKTNIKCGGCVATVTPFLNQEKSIEKWEVDTTNPEKILTVSGKDVNDEAVKSAVKQAGFTIESR